MLHHLINKHVNNNILKLLIMEKIKKIRVNKFLSEIGYCSRREADRLIEQNKLMVNGDVPKMGTKVSEHDVITVEGLQINKSIRTKDLSCI